MNTKVKNSKLKEIVKRNYSIAKIILLISIIGLGTKIVSAIDIYPSDYTDKYFLEMKGTIKPAEYKDSNVLKNIDSAEVSVINSEDKLFEKVYSNDIGECYLKIPLNEQFIVKISKKGWVTKIINIDTRLNDDKFKKYHMLFEVEMFEDINELNTPVLNHPIANVYFNEYLKKFDYGYRYTNGVNKKIEKIYLNYYNQHKKSDKSDKRISEKKSDKQVFEKK
jgi:hypothetical protein